MGVRNKVRSSNRRAIRLFVFSSGMLLVVAFRVCAATYYVATNGNDAAAGTSWETAVLTITNAIAKTIAAGDVVLVSNGTYLITNTIVFPSFGSPGLTVCSLNGASNTIINAQGLSRCFFLQRGTIDGFTLTNGFENSGAASHKSGGAIAVAGYTPVRILNCIITDCISTNYGGGIGVVDWSGGSGADIIISNCVFRNNSAPYSGAIDLYCNRANVYDCRFENNRATFTGDLGGGAIRCQTHTNTIARCDFYNNVASNRGGAVRLLYGTPQTKVISNCTFVGNSGLVEGGGVYAASALVVNSLFVSNVTVSGHGGGAYCGSASIVSNCRFVANTAQRNGGGIYNLGTVVGSLVASNSAGWLGGGIYQSNATAVIRNVTIVSNVATTNAGGVYLYGGGVENSIIYFNAAGVSGSNWTYVGGYFTNTCTAPSVAAYGAGNIADDPLFIDFVVGNYRLQSRSPCINAGLNQDWMVGAFDLDGNPRIRQFRVDMGAFEGLCSGMLIKVR